MATSFDFHFTTDWKVEEQLVIAVASGPMIVSHREDEDRREILKLTRLVHRGEYAVKRRRAPRGSYVVNAPLTAISHHMAQISSLKDSMDALRWEMSSLHSQITESIDEMRRAVPDRDVLLKCLETSVTSSADVLSDLKERLEEALASRTGQSSAIPDDMRKKCVDSMMGKTLILNRDERKVSLVRGLFENLFDESDVTSCLLEFLKSQPGVTVMIDCDSECIGNMKKVFRYNDGREGIVSNWMTFADFSEYKVYIGGKVDENRSVELVRVGLAKSLAEMSFLLAFENEGRPYERGDVIKEQELKRALDEAEENGKSGVALGVIIEEASNKKTQLGKEICLLSIVPMILALNGSTGGTSWLREQVPLLFGFFMDHVVVTLLFKARMSQ